MGFRQVACRLGIAAAVHQYEKTCLKAVFRVFVVTDNPVAAATGFPRPRLAPAPAGAGPAPSSTKAKVHAPGMHFSSFVDPTGIEPVTSSMPWKRSTK